MNIHRSSGIILRTRPLTETSLIVHWLTPDFGRLATVAKGARRPKSPFRGKLDLFHLADFSFSRSRRSDLHTLREAVLRRMHPALRRHLACLRQAAYAAGLIELATETETALPALFELMCCLLDHLEEHPAHPGSLLAFEARLLDDVGLSPLGEAGSLDADTAQVLEQLLTLDWAALSNHKPSPAQALELERFLHAFLTRHLGRVPRGRAAALSPGLQSGAFFA